MDRSYYIFNDGKLSRKDNTITFEKADGTKRDLPIEKMCVISILCRK